MTLGYVRQDTEREKSGYFGKIIGKKKTVK